MSDDNFNNGYLTVGEFSEIVGIPAETLRRYDNDGIFHPAKRGVELKNEYRLYSPTQITSAKMLRVLSEIGVPTQTIKALVKDRTPEKLLKLLNKHKGMIEDHIRYAEEIYYVIKVFTDHLNDGISATENEISVKHLEEVPIILGGLNDFRDIISFHREFTRFCNGAHEPGLNTCFPIGGYWDSMDNYLANPSQPARFFSFDVNGYERIQEGDYLIGYTRGYYGQVNDLPQRMAKYAKKNGYVFTGPVFNSYVFDELSVVDPKQYLLKAIVRVNGTKPRSRGQFYRI